jgi:hypothetical protein
MFKHREPHRPSSEQQRTRGVAKHAAKQERPNGDRKSRKRDGNNRSNKRRQPAGASDEAGDSSLHS